MSVQINSAAVKMYKMLPIIKLIESINSMINKSICGTLNTPVRARHFEVDLYISASNPAQITHDCVADIRCNGR
jgi:hypothetical protein